MVVSGPAYLWNRTASDKAVRSFAEAFSMVRAELEAEAELNPVFAAHLEMLDDPMLTEAVEASLSAGKSDMEALDEACKGICDMFAGIDDEYLKARTDDVRDVFGRLRDAVCGTGAVSQAKIPEGSVLVAVELLPSDMVNLDFGRIAGILCQRGSASSHVSIIAHTNGVPVQFGVDISHIAEGDLVTVDDPMAGTSQIAMQVRAAGRKVYVNTGSIDEIRSAIAAGADGIGIFRTEFMFLGRESMPSRKEQCELYLEAMLACCGKPLTIRLLDIGGDKVLPFLPVPPEDNPFLGVRGVRFGLANPELYEAQLGAIADAAISLRLQRPEWFASATPVRVMIPMVCKVEEVLRVREMLYSLAGGDVPVSLGIMVETPAVALDAESLPSILWQRTDAILRYLSFTTQWLLPFAVQ